MKRKIAFLLLALLVACTVVLCGCAGNIDANRNRKINSVSHRGFGEAPENTLIAYRIAKDKGFNMVECDVRFTKDCEAVLLHDRSVNRTSNGRGKISEMTFDEVRKLDFGSWKGAEYVGTCIPSFSEFIDLCVELALSPYIEIKNGATAEQVRYLVDIVDEALIDVTWIARNIDYLKQISDIRPNDRLGLIADVVTKKAVKSMAELDDGRNVCFMDCNYMFLIQSQVDICKQLNVPLEIWTLDNERRILNIDPYISGVTSNFINAEKLFAEI